MKPKNVGSPAGDPQEQLLLEPCSGECTGVKVQPGLPMESRSVYLWVSLGVWETVLPLVGDGPTRLREPVGGGRCMFLSVSVSLFECGTCMSKGLFLPGRACVAVLLTCVWWQVP